jgi:beta-lactamase regulating signal transducer with metallopeptidase domain
VTSLELLLRQPLFLSLGWALVHFLWQGAAIAGLLALALRAGATKGSPVLRSAEARYLAACVALLLLAACPVITLTASLSVLVPSAPSLSAYLPAPETQSAARPASLLPAVTTLSPVTGRRSPADLIQPLLPGVVAAWLLGVAALSVRLAGGWLLAQRLARYGTRSLHGPPRERFRDLARRMGIDRPVLLLESTVVSVPTVIGWLRAAVLVPTGALCGLPPGQLEALLAHELAHIRRNDYLINLLQAVAETVLFYHPAVWWVSGRIRHEREHCCDDLAVRFLGDRVTYARALTALEELRGAPVSPALAANSGDLLRRIHRVLGRQSAPTGLSATGVGGMIVITLILAAAVLQASTHSPRWAAGGDTSRPPIAKVAASAPGSSTAAEINRQRQVQQRQADSLKAERLRQARLKQRLRELQRAEQARQAQLRQKAEQARQAHLQRRKLDAAREELRLQQRRRDLQKAQRVRTALLAPAGQVKPRASSGKAQTDPKAAPPTRRASLAAPGVKAAAQGVKAGATGAPGTVKGVPGPSIQDVPVLDLRGVPASQVARIRLIKDVGVVLLDERNRGALSGASLEDVGATVVAGPEARVMVEPVLEFSRAALEAMLPAQKLILVGIVVFKPDVLPALVRQKFASLNVTGVLLATAGVRGALLGTMQVTGISATLPDDAGPVAHSIGHNQITAGYLSRLPDRSVYVNVGAVEIAPDVSEQLLAQKIAAYVNVGATIGPNPLLDRLKSISIANVGTFAQDDGDDDEDDE